jgi:hypothetical protein
MEINLITVQNGHDQSINVVWYILNCTGCVRDTESDVRLEVAMATNNVARSDQPQQSETEI